MRPPQDNPTRQAVSSATPNSSIRGAPLAITSAASSTTATSTHPPEPEPKKLPSASVTRCEPIGRGAEPHVSTTVAIATSRPASRHDSAAARTSSSLVSIQTSPFVPDLWRDEPDFGVRAVAIRLVGRMTASAEHGPLDTIHSTSGSGNDLDGACDAERSVRIGCYGQWAVALGGSGGGRPSRLAPRGGRRRGGGA